MKFKRVADMHVNCSLQVRNFGLGTIVVEDVCGKPARYAVKMENGSLMWRCFEHRFVRRMETGDSLTFIPVDEDAFVV